MAETKKDRSRSTGLATPSSSPGAVPFGLAPQLPLTFDKRDGITNIKDYEKLGIADERKAHTRVEHLIQDYQSL